MPNRGIFGAISAAIGLGAGVVAERLVVKRRRRTDPEAGERFGERRGIRSRMISLSDGARLYVEEAGPRRRRGTVFIHGSSLRTDVWHYQLGGIDDHRLVFYDLRGHGRSYPKGSAEYSIETLGRDLEAVVTDSELEEVVLVGHSVGGMIALDYCSRRSDQLGEAIKGVVLLNATHAPPIETLTGGAALARVERVLRRPLDFVGSQHQHIERLRKIIRPSDAVFWTVSFAGFGPQPSAAQVDFTYDMLAETPLDVIFDLIKAYRDFNVGAVLADITVPALVIGGRCDRLTVPEASEFIASKLPKAELNLIEDCGHMSMLERHREVNRLLEGFLADVVG